MLVDVQLLESDITPLVQTLGERNTFSIDLETTGLNPLDSRIHLCQVSTYDKTYVMIPSKVDMTRLMPFLRDPKWLKIVQNAVFEGKFLKYFYDTDMANIFDTFLAEKLINTDSQNNALEDLALKYAKVTLNKKIRESFYGAKPIAAFSDEQLEYAANDAIVLHPIYEFQKKLIQDNGLQRVADIEFALTTVVSDMEIAGVPLDKKLWQSKLTKYEVELEESRLKMHSLIFDGTGIPEQTGLFTRDAIDLDSPKKVKEAFHKLGIDVAGTDERIIALVDHPAARELLNYKGLAKIMSSFGDNILDMLHPFTGRIHADFQQIGTRTGRFACKKPNLQQMPAEFRECVSLPDYKIVSADFANIELRILAKYSQDKAFLTAFNSGEDPHKSTAAGMFNIPIEKVTKEQRFIAKTINFGLVYGMGVDKLKDMLNAKKEEGEERLTKEQVTVLFGKYKKTYKGAIDWLRVTGEEGLAQRYSTTMLGRKRNLVRPIYEGDDELFNKQISAVKRKAANSPIQGTSADITKLAMLNVYHDLSKYNYRAKMIIQVHDEIVVLAHKKEAESVKDVVVESMMDSAQEILQEIPVKVDAHIGDVWSKG